MGWRQRTASAIVEAFLILNGYEIKADISEIVELVLAIESDKFKVDEIENWMRQRVIAFVDMD